MPEHHASDEWQQIFEVLAREERPRETLEEQVELLHDVRAVRDVITKYGFYLDAGHWDALFDLFIEDCERVLAGSMDQVVRGRDALRREYEQGSSLPRKRADGTVEELDTPYQHSSLDARHLYAAEVIRVSDDNRQAWATGQYTIILGRTEADGRYRHGAHHGRYVFTLTKVDGQWKIARQYLASHFAHNPMVQKMYEDSSS